jgi:hypothetical protein
MAWPRMTGRPPPVFHRLPLAGETLLSSCLAPGHVVCRGPHTGDTIGLLMQCGRNLIATAHHNTNCIRQRTKCRTAYPEEMWTWPTANQLQCHDSIKFSAPSCLGGELPCARGRRTNSEEGRELHSERVGTVAARAIGQAESLDRISGSLIAYTR